MRAWVDGLVGGLEWPVRLISVKFSHLFLFFLQAAITAATVGYGDISPQTDGGKVFACFFIVVGASTMAGVISLPTDIYMSRQTRKKIVEGS